MISPGDGLTTVTFSPGSSYGGSVSVGDDLDSSTYTPYLGEGRTPYGFLLNEDGSYILLGSGGKIIIDASVDPATVGDDISSATYTTGDSL